MEGTKEARGVNFRTLEELFHIIKEREKLYRYDISVSVLEVYNEQIRDLLAVGSQPGAVSKRLVNMVFFSPKCFSEVEKILKLLLSPCVKFHQSCYG